MGDRLRQIETFPGIRQLVEWLLARYTQHGTSCGIHEHNVPLRISYKHALGEAVEDGVERCFAFAQRLLRPLTLGGVGEDDGDPPASFAADARGVDLEPPV